MSQPWSLRRRLLVASLVWTAMLMSILGIVTVLAAHRRIGYASYLHLALIVFILVLGASAGLAQLRLGLSPFERLRRQLLAVRDGRERQVTGVYPVEVQPLVDDLNSLLDQREQAVDRARAKAADLAHGLKTPLAIIAHESARAGAEGQTDLAARIGGAVERMRRQIDYHLAHARAAASSGPVGPRSALSESVDGLVRALSRLHVERGLVIESAVASDLIVQIERADLDEILGNLIDNACKWARARVAISARLEGSAVVVAVDDDGPGLAVSMREAVLRRGVRADEAAPGSGLGLAIVRDLAELYQGAIALTDSPLGGLRAELRLPAPSVRPSEGAAGPPSSGAIP